MIILSLSLSLSVAGLRTGLVRPRHGTLGLTGAAAMTMAAMTSPWAGHGVPIGMIGLAGFVLWLVWIVTYSVRLLRIDRPTGGPEVAEPATPITVMA